MRAAILGFVGGAAFLQTRAALPAHPALALLASSLVFAGLLMLLRQGRPLVRTAIALLFGAALGFFWAAALAHAALAPQLGKADEGRDITLIGTIDNLPYKFGQGVRFNFAVEKVIGNDTRVPPRVPPHLSLAWYSGFRDALFEVGDVQPGERWQLTVRLQRPHGNANPDGFDYEVWLLEQGLRATGYVRPDQDQDAQQRSRHPDQDAQQRSRRPDQHQFAQHGNRRLDDFVFGFGNLVERCRATLRERILRALAGKQYAGVIVALVVGDQRSIDHGSVN